MNIDSGTSAPASWLTQQLRAWGIERLTEIQQLAVEAGAANGASLVVVAPTSSGKTLVGEIAAAAALRNGKRAIYLVSHKALAEQKFRDFQSRFGEAAEQPLATVALSTGDRDEGDIHAQLIVATYEKALGLLISGQLHPADSVLIADEFQIVGDSGRGADVEVLCSLCKQKNVGQFIALAATAANPQDLAGWMGCSLVVSHAREVPLHQEIWWEGRRYRVTLGQQEGQQVPAERTPDDVISVVETLLSEGKGPVLVFTESRREAMVFAGAFGRHRPRIGNGIALAEQLELFSEQTESSDLLKQHVEKRVAFHTADLTPQERQVIEGGFDTSSFEVCFATPTLAAGVNFPFRSIVFPKLTYAWGDRAGTAIKRPDYRNMSGRAGRLGIHEDGFSVLLPSNRRELEHANELVLPDNDNLYSQMSKLSLRKLVLLLVSARLVSSPEEVASFFGSTLFWYQVLEKNPAKLEELRTNIEAAVLWLFESGLIAYEARVLSATALGNAAALSGLLPSSAVNFAALLRVLAPALESNFEQWAPGLIYAACASDEFLSTTPSRFLPFPNKSQQESVAYWATQKLPVPLDRSNLRLAQCAHAIALYAQGVAERRIAFATELSSGGTHRLSLDVAWVLDGVHKISCVPELNCSQTATNRLSMLARRVRWGAPPEALDIIRIADRHNVPGFGRQRAMALLSQGISTLSDILSTAKEKLSEVLRNEKRTSALIDAVSATMGVRSDGLPVVQGRIADRLGLKGTFDQCERELGTAYEKAIAAMLRAEGSWVVTELDNGIRQNVPDLLIRLQNRELLIECKTCTKSPPLIKKEEAFAVMQKAADFDPAIRRVTLGKPAFDETTKVKALAARDITLVEHTIFMEGLLRVLTGTITADQFLHWLAAPGVAEIERLQGTPTFRL